MPKGSAYCYTGTYLPVVAIPLLPLRESFLALKNGNAVEWRSDVADVEESYNLRVEG